MSGGVDSSTVAALLVHQGYRVVGLTMQLWNQRRLPELQTGATSGRCCSLDDVYDARAVAQQLQIPHYVINFEQQFEERVVRPFVDEYLRGLTPIPCTLCNNHVKFDDFHEMAAGIGASSIATGHYARTDEDPLTGRFRLRAAVDASKDQTYFLWGLTQAQMRSTQFPLGALTKAEVRQLADRLDVPVAAKGDSQEICFVPNGDYAQFIDAYLREQGEQQPALEGEIVSTQGQVLGRHSGVHHFTVGQRKGLGVAVGEPLYVIATDPKSQRVVVGPTDSLLRSEFFVRDVNFVSVPPFDRPVRAHVKIRNKHLPAGATVSPVDSNRVRVVCDLPQRAVTPGQAAVFYDDEGWVLAGGWIS
jgi:tRNA-specific 2-thiouridylase